MVVPRTRLAPEDPFPAHVEDGWGLIRWLGSGKSKKVLEGVGVKVDWERVALGGASAGGNVVSFELFFEVLVFAADSRLVWRL